MSHPLGSPQSRGTKKSSRSAGEGGKIPPAVAGMTLQQVLLAAAFHHSGKLTSPGF
jgi:hypothetical protein